MTLFLASVATLEDAAIALDGGVDIIEVAGPSDPERVRAFVGAVGHVRPVCAIVDDELSEPAASLAAAQAMADAGADYIKVAAASEASVRELAPIAAEHRLIAVMFADRDPDFGLLPVLRESGFAGATLDTARGSATRLLDAMDVTTLAEFVGACRAHGLSAGLAGGLEAPDIPRLLRLEPDVLGFHSALTRGTHTTVDPRAVRTIRGLIPRPTDLPDPPPPYGDEPDECDTVFVRDLVLPVSIGAYAGERAATQRVGFAVDVQLAPLRRPAHGLRDVLSYDIIIDGIRLLIAEGHVALIETLAERIAAMLLAYPRVVRVTVRLEKLDRGNGVAGTRIVRRRGG
ncbi:MAG TPA: (5-formylfuran-3-yl)methyl phosphate synthase [Acidisphaera sp.]|nr:(5-formylfuran-3-yl)methyl phosphate synthase [Acidisphaera sp.]